MTATASIPSHSPPFCVSGCTPGGQNPPNGKETPSGEPSIEAVKAEKQRNRAKRFRNKPGQRAKEAARLRKWRQMKRTGGLTP